MEPKMKKLVQLSVFGFFALFLTMNQGLAAFDCTKINRSEDEWNEVVASIQKPSNSSGELLRSSLIAASKQGKMDLESIRVCKSESNHYFLEIRFNAFNPQPLVGNRKNDILVSVELSFDRLRGQAHILSFRAEDLIQMFPQR